MDTQKVSIFYFPSKFFECSSQNNCYFKNIAYICYLIDTNTFRTYNSIYRWTVIEDVNTESK